MECQHHLKENKKKLNEEISCISLQNQRLLRHNAMLNNQITNHDNEVAQLRNKLVKIEGENEKLQTNVIVSVDNGNKNLRQMATRIHKLYMQYMKSESCRKSLAYQKKYLLMLIGGFKDSEEATLALLAQMGAYPNDDSIIRKRYKSHASMKSQCGNLRGISKFRSVARVSIACTRMKYLVSKWIPASKNLTSCIENKHGVKIQPHVSEVPSLILSTRGCYRSSSTISTGRLSNISSREESYSKSFKRTPQPIEAYLESLGSIKKTLVDSAPSVT